MNINFSLFGETATDQQTNQTSGVMVARQKERKADTESAAAVAAAAEKKMVSFTDYWLFCTKYVIMFHSFKCSVLIFRIIIIFP